MTQAELAILHLLWQQGPATIRKITDRLYAGGRPSHYATVQKLLERLEAKQYVLRERSRPVHVFSAAIGRDDLISRRLQSVAEQLCGGSWTPLLTNLVQGRRLSARDRRELRQLIEDLDRRDPKSGRPDEGK